MAPVPTGSPRCPGFRSHCPAIRGPCPDRITPLPRSIRTLSRLTRPRSRPPRPRHSLADTKPRPGARWHLNLYRCDRANQAFLAWSPALAGGFHTPEKFGVLEFTE